MTLPTITVNGASATITSLYLTYKLDSDLGYFYRLATISGSMNISGGDTPSSLVIGSWSGEPSYIAYVIKNTGKQWSIQFNDEITLSEIGLVINIDSFCTAKQLQNNGIFQFQLKGYREIYPFSTIILGGSNYIIGGVYTQAQKLWNQSVYEATEQTIEDIVPEISCLGCTLNDAMVAWTYMMSEARAWATAFTPTSIDNAKEKISSLNDGLATYIGQLSAACALGDVPEAYERIQQALDDWRTFLGGL